MTELIYLTDSYRKELKTEVISCSKKGASWEVILDKTIFYPQGGGQPSDRGEIVGPNGKAHVKHARMHEDTVIHECAIEGTISPGELVSCELNWDERCLHMRVHSAGHIVHEAVMRTAPTLSPKKGEHGSHAYIEYTGSLPIDKTYEIERLANEIVVRNVSLTTEFVTLEELQKRSSFVPEHLPKHKPLRIVTISGYQAIPDGGTQVKRTGEVGNIIVSEIENSEDSVRVHYSLEQTKVQEILSGNDTISAPHFIGMLLAAKDDAFNQIAVSDLPPDALKLTFLGGKSALAELIKKITDVAPAERQQAGIVITQVKQAIEQAIEGQNRNSKREAQNETLTDMSLPGHIPIMGHYHPTTLVIREMNAIFASMGFSIGDGPEVETDEYNYNRVNLPPDHPARDLQDTLYIDEPNWLLRTHTSSVESHLLATVTPPFRYVIPGKVYRYENANATNNIMFYQYEGMAVATDITMADLKGTLDVFVRKFFGEKRETRFRCKYYPQVEPGVGVDISCAFCNKKGCPVCKGRGWIEMLGAGMVHPNMFTKAGLDPSKYSGFAWGMGLDRIVMQRYGIADIRSLYNGDIGYKE